MIKKYSFVILYISLLWGFAAQGADEDELPMVTAKISVLGDAGKLLAGVQVGAGCSMLKRDEKLKDSAMSDANGVCVLKLKALSGINVWTAYEGYYPSIAPARHENPIDERFRFDPFIRDDVDPRRDREVPLPMKKEVKLEASITLREIKNPISLYVKAIQMDIPARDVWLGYDFEVGDWVKPYGNGIKSNMRIRSAPKRLDPEVTDGGVLLPGVATLEIDFGQDGGLVRVTKDNGWLSVSDMKMPHLAPEAGYEQLPTLKIEQTTFEDSSEMGKANGYFFRTRVKREGDKVISANYGKLLGRIDYRPVQLDKAWWGDEKKNAPAFGSIEFTYYFNPTVNDRNLEFDVKQNLFKRSDQWLRQP